MTCDYDNDCYTIGLRFHLFMEQSWSWSMVMVK